MKNKWIIVGLAGMGVFLASEGAAARSYNPLKWIKKNPGPTASEELAAHSDEANKLATQLQMLLPPRTNLKDACAGFKDLGECVAALHVSHNLNIKFNCLKWDLTNVQPKGDVKSCSAPASGKEMSLTKAIRSLKPDADSRVEAKNAERRAHEDIKDASS
ncbi:MAG TPA: hypothetical protein VFN26_15740 [Candidatus Acidoferrum sp.]|nr:hypothetical protein [Candidatus Acidoferrum sp.]